MQYSTGEDQVATCEKDDGAGKFAEQGEWEDVRRGEEAGKDAAGGGV